MATYSTAVVAVEAGNCNSDYRLRASATLDIAAARGFVAAKVAEDLSVT